MSQPGVAPRVSIRCRSCHKMTEWIDGQCQECGFTGRCGVCGERIARGEENESYPQAHLGDCEADARGHDEADAWRD